MRCGVKLSDQRAGLEEIDVAISSLDIGVHCLNVRVMGSIDLLAALP